MSDLIEKIRAAMDARARVLEGSGILGWLTVDLPDGMFYTTAASGHWFDGEICWVVDGKEATSYSSAQIVHDEDLARRQLVAHRKILDEHLLTVSKHEQLPFDPVSGERIPDSWDVECARCGWCSSDPASGCPTVLALAEMYDLDVKGALP